MNDKPYVTDTRNAHATADGYNVADERRNDPGARAAYVELRALAERLGVPQLYVRCGTWGSGTVETREGLVIGGELPTALAVHVEFRGPADED